jgi:hypothetical protein
MRLISKDLKSYLKSFEVLDLFFLRFNTPLWQRGQRGDFLNKKSSPFALKIPLDPPFPKGDLFQPLEQSSL